MRVIYFLFAVIFNVCSKWLVYLSTRVTFVYASFYIAFAEEYDINIFEIIESRHFDRLQATSVIGEPV